MTSPNKQLLDFIQDLIKHHTDKLTEARTSQDEVAIAQHSEAVIVCSAIALRFCQLYYIDIEIKDEGPLKVNK